MVLFTGIKMSLFPILVLQFTTAATIQLFRSLTVRVGDEVTLPCENMLNNQINCDSSTWLYVKSSRTSLVVLVSRGEIVEKVKAKSDRLSVTENCSLVVKRVTDEDVGRYGCRQIRSGKQQGQDALVELSVLTLAEHNDTDERTLHCSVKTYGQCSHTVKWLFRRQDVDKDNQDIRTSGSPCSASVTFPTSHFNYTSRYLKLFLCAVSNFYNAQVFPFRSLPSGEKPGEDTITEIESTTTTENNTEAGSNDSAKLRDGWWWLYIIVALVLVALFIIIVAVVRWKRTKGNKTRMNDNVGLTSNLPVTQSAQETSQDTADPEDGISYASISYTKKTNSKAQAWRKNDDDEGDAVTYTTVKASSADPSTLYAAIN